MNVHQNARLMQRGRVLMVERIASAVVVRQAAAVLKTIVVRAAEIVAKESANSAGCRGGAPVVYSLSKGVVLGDSQQSVQTVEVK
jgi:hypothetical protein